MVTAAMDCDTNVAMVYGLTSETAINGFYKLSASLRYMRQAWDHEDTVGVHWYIAVQYNTILQSYWELTMITSCRGNTFRIDRWIPS